MNTRSNTLEIQGIIAQLDELQTQQSVLIERLGQLTSADGNLPVAAPDEPTRAITESGYECDLFPDGAPVLVIGNRVQIKNPGRQQPDRGIITKISRNRITVQGDNGILVSRAPKNLILQRQEATSSASSNPTSDHTEWTSNSGHTNA